MVESTDKLLCMAEGCLLKYGDPLETMNCQECKMYIWGLKKIDEMLLGEDIIPTMETSTLYKVHPLM